MSSPLWIMPAPQPGYWLPSNVPLRVAFGELLIATRLRIRTGFKSGRHDLFFRKKPFGENVEGLSQFSDQNCAVERAVQTYDFEQSRLASSSAVGDPRRREPRRKPAR
jgi:hypothetical protein